MTGVFPDWIATRAAATPDRVALISGGTSWTFALLDAEITRTAVGEFSLDRAIKLEELAEAAQAGKLASCLIALENLLLNFPDFLLEFLVELPI